MAKKKGAKQNPQAQQTEAGGSNAPVTQQSSPEKQEQHKKEQPKPHEQQQPSGSEWRQQKQQKAGGDQKPGPQQQQQGAREWHQQKQQQTGGGQKQGPQQGHYQQGEPKPQQQQQGAREWRQQKQQQAGGDQKQGPQQGHYQQGEPKPHQQQQGAREWRQQKQQQAGGDQKQEPQQKQGARESHQKIQQKPHQTGERQQQVWKGHQQAEYRQTAAVGHSQQPEQRAGVDAPEQKKRDWRQGDYPQQVPKQPLPAEQQLPQQEKRWPQQTETAEVCPPTKQVSREAGELQHLSQGLERQHLGEPHQEKKPYQQATPQQGRQMPPGGGAPYKQAAGDKRPQQQQQQQIAVKSKFPPGTFGRQISLETNHLAIDVSRLPSEAHHYDVAIDPDKPKALMRHIMETFRRKHYESYSPSFDGRKNMYSARVLPVGDSPFCDTVVMSMDDSGRTREYKVTIKRVKTLDLTPLKNMCQPFETSSMQDALQCIDIVLRNAPARNCISVGRNFFNPPEHQTHYNLTGGMELYDGFYQSAVRGWKPLLNVDVAHKAFPKEMSCIDVLLELCGGRNLDAGNLHTMKLSGYQYDALNGYMKTLRIAYQLPNSPASKRVYRVNGLDRPAKEVRFTLEDGKACTVAEYFANVKRYQLRYPLLPTVSVGSQQRATPILLPLELCTVQPGQAVNRKMTEQQTRNMIRRTATNTTIRHEKINRGIVQAGYNQSPYVREFGISIANQFEQINGRVLPPPLLQYKSNTVQPSKGVWRADRMGFLEPAVITKWTIACADRYRPNNMDQFGLDLMKMAPSMQMRFAEKAILPFESIGQSGRLNDLVSYFKQMRHMDLIIVVTPSSGPMYSLVKQAAEVSVGCLTQCIKSDTMRRLNGQIISNILLKINSKMNGKNHCLANTSVPPVLARPCMIMGADVTHPSPDAKHIPSVAAITASHDRYAFSYNVTWRLQPPKVEIIEDLCNATYEHLMNFYRLTKNLKPEKIIFFRDGVSEGQFEQVRVTEIQAIRQACSRCHADYKPTLTFIVVQKRHHTRFFPKNPADSNDRNLNVPAGTCVDTTITNPTMQDFYLVSHASIQGVAKPTKYCTLWDENNLSNDMVEQLAYHLCYMFTRCNRSVSYPTPTYYAHLAAARIKTYIENEQLNMSKLKDAQERFAIQECIIKKHPMFFV